MSSIDRLRRQADRHSRRARVSARALGDTMSNVGERIVDAVASDEARVGFFVAGVVSGQISQRRSSGDPSTSERADQLRRELGDRDVDTVNIYESSTGFSGIVTRIVIPLMVREALDKAGLLGSSSN